MDLKEAAVARFAEPMKAFLAEDLLAGVIKQKLDELVADSSNTYDDALVGLLYPMLEDAIKEQLDKLHEKVSS